MSPHDIEVLIHCNCCSGRHPRYDAPAFSETIQGFIADGMVIYKDDGLYQTTEKGAAHVSQLCSIPYPVKQFVGYDGKTIKL